MEKKDKNMIPLDLSKNATYVVRDGEIHQLHKPESGFGKQIITWQSNKPCTSKIETDHKF